jgi:uncharacterized protein YmfQ (DUF2313 family)
MAALTKTQFLTILQKFLPAGAAWPRTAGSTLSRLLASFASLFAVIELRLRDLLAELNPATALELLPEWEAFVGACDECCTSLGTVAQRRARVVTKLTDRGSLSRAYFLQLAVDLGYTGTTITEFRPTSCEMSCEAPVVDAPWRFVWTVNLPHQVDNHAFFRADARCDGRLDVYTFGALECQFMRLKPAHTYVIFTYEAAT